MPILLFNGRKLKYYKGMRFIQYRSSALMASLILLLSSFAHVAWAHLPEDSYLFLRDDQGAPSLTWDISAGNLAELMPLDLEVSEAVLRQALLDIEDEVVAIALDNLKMSQPQGDCMLERSAYGTTNYTSGLYASLKFLLHCPSAAPITMTYTLMTGVESGHRGILLYNWVEGNSARHEFFEGKPSFTLTPSQASVQTGQNSVQKSSSYGESSSWLSSFVTYVKEGVWHIWIGVDHILFIVTLLLPAFLFWRERQWQALAGFRPAMIETIKIVTAFTLAHSITLTLSTLGWVSMPAKITESIIALSVVVVALNNIRPMFSHGRWSLAFLFGLLHGFGFAYVLGDLGLHSGGLLVSLAGFNIGVELGQLAILLVLLPLLYLLRNNRIYQKFLMPGLSGLIALVALIWIVERTTGNEWLGF